MEGREEMPDKSAPLPGENSAVTAELVEVSPDDAMGFFRMKIDMIANQSTAESRRKAVRALMSFAGDRVLGFESFTEELMYEWAAWLVQNGYSQNTAAYYMKQIATLRNKAVADGLAAPSEAIASVRARLLSLSQSEFSPLDNGAFEKLQRFFREIDYMQAARRTAADIVAFAILNGGMTFDAIAQYKKDEYQGDNPIIKRIVERYSRPRNRYLFPLNQSKRTAAQLRSDLAKLFYIALSPYGLMPAGSAESAAFDLWCMAALRCGVSPRKLMAITARRYPSFNPVLQFIAPEPISPDEAQAVRAEVADVLTANPLHWYAMQFRPHVDFARVAAAMEAVSREVSFAELFYPSEEIMRRTGGRLRRTVRPVIPGLLFFRSRATDITPMFRHIGHLAWCYRRTASASGGYAIIPPREMAEYQRVIGSFTPDMEVVPAGVIDIAPDDRVIMLGGSFAGHPATVTEVKTTGEGRTICRLSFIGPNMVEWVVKADPRQVRKIPRQQFELLLAADRAS